MIQNRHFLLKKKPTQKKTGWLTLDDVGGRWISAAEHAQAKAELEAKRNAAIAGEEKDEEEDDEEDDDEDFTEEAVETFPAGHEVAVTIAEDVFPNAIDYFMGDSIDSDIELDLDDDDDDDEMMEG